MDRFEIAQGKEPPLPPAGTEYRGIKGYDSLPRKDDPSRPSLSVSPDTSGNQLLEIRIPAMTIHQVLPRDVIPQSDTEEDERRGRALDILSADLLEVVRNAVLAIITDRGRVNEYGYADAEHSMGALLRRDLSRSQDFWFSQDPLHDPRNRSSTWPVGSSTPLHERSQLLTQAQMQNLFANSWPEPSAPSDPIEL